MFQSMNSSCNAIKHLSIFEYNYFILAHGVKRVYWFIAMSSEGIDEVMIEVRDLYQINAEPKRECPWRHTLLRRLK